MQKIDENLIAPCGMNCSLCVAYQFNSYNLNRHGFNRKYCPGCLPRGRNCLHMGDACELLANGQVRFCFECEQYPCSRLKSLNKRYCTKYHMSMIENLNYIKEHGLEQFLVEQEEKWYCQKCGQMKCCHNGLCLVCDIDKLKKNKKYLWKDSPNENK